VASRPDATRERAKCHDDSDGAGVRVLCVWSGRVGCQARIVCWIIREIGPYAVNDLGWYSVGSRMDTFYRSGR